MSSRHTLSEVRERMVNIILSGGGKNVRCTTCGGHDIEVYVRK